MSAATTAGRWLAVAGLVVAILCVAAAAASGLGYRADLWHFRTGFLILRFAFFIALAAAALSLLGVLLSGGVRGTVVAGIAGLVIALGFAYVPWQWKQTVDALPYIHDITTDTDDPPQLVVAATLRREGDHPVTYDGPEVAAQQKKAYPDIVPATFSAPEDKVFEAARKVLEGMGMKINGADPAGGTI